MTYYLLECEIVGGIFVASAPEESTGGEKPDQGPATSANKVRVRPNSILQSNLRKEAYSILLKENSSDPFKVENSPDSVKTLQVNENGTVELVYDDALCNGILSCRGCSCVLRLNGENKIVGLKVDF